MVRGHQHIVLGPDVLVPACFILQRPPIVCGATEGTGMQSESTPSLARSQWPLVLNCTFAILSGLPIMRTVMSLFRYPLKQLVSNIEPIYKLAVVSYVQTNVSEQDSGM